MTKPSATISKKSNGRQRKQAQASEKTKQILAKKRKRPVKTVTDLKSPVKKTTTKKTKIVAPRKKEAPPSAFITLPLSAFSGRRKYLNPREYYLLPENMRKGKVVVTANNWTLNDFLKRHGDMPTFESLRPEIMDWVTDLRDFFRNAGIVPGSMENTLEFTSDEGIWLAGALGVNEGKGATAQLYKMLTCDLETCPLSDMRTGLVDRHVSGQVMTALAKGQIPNNIKDELKLIYELITIRACCITHNCNQTMSNHTKAIKIADVMAMENQFKPTPISCGVPVIPSVKPRRVVKKTNATDDESN